MTAGTVLTTALHDDVFLDWSVTVDGFAVPVAQTVGSEATWSLDSNARADLTVVRVTPTLPEGMSVDAMVVGYWRLAGDTRRDMPGLRCEVAESSRRWDAGPSSGEHLDAIEFDDPRLNLCIGTPDSEWLHGRAGRHELPARWTDELPMLGDTTRRDPVTYLSRGLEVRLPALHGEVADAVIAAAVKITQGDASVDTWYAVDLAGRPLERRPQP